MKKFLWLGTVVALLNTLNATAFDNPPDNKFGIISSDPKQDLMIRRVKNENNLFDIKLCKKSNPEICEQTLLTNITLNDIEKLAKLNNSKLAKFFKTSSHWALTLGEIAGSFAICTGGGSLFRPTPANIGQMSEVSGIGIQHVVILAIFCPAAMIVIEDELIGLRGKLNHWYSKNTNLESKAIGELLPPARNYSYQGDIKELAKKIEASSPQIKQFQKTNYSYLPSTNTQDSSVTHAGK